jgi:hypothetical protein
MHLSKRKLSPYMRWNGGELALSTGEFGSAREAAGLRRCLEMEGHAVLRR